MGKIKTKELLSFTRGVFKTATFRQSGITFSTTIINGALGAVFYIIAARFLGPSQFGLMNVAIVFLMLGASIGGLGVNTGLVRFVGKYIKSDKPKAFKFLKISLKANLLVGVVFIILGLLLPAPIAHVMFDKPELSRPLMISFFGMGFLLLFGFATRALQSFQQFWLWGLLQVGTNLLRVIVVIALFFAGIFTLEAGLWVYAFIPLAGFLFAIIFVLPRNFLSVRGEFSVAKEFFHYNKWIAGFTLFAAFSSRADTFIAARLLPPMEIGYYSAAYQMVYIVPQIVGALGTVFSPKMASMGDLRTFLTYFKKAQIMVLGLVFLGILAAPLAALLVPYIFGPEYMPSIPIFFVLLLSMLVFLASVPLHNAVLYYFSSPKLFFWMSIGHFAIMFGVGWLMISVYGVMGAATTTLLGSIFNLLVPAIWVYKKIQK